MLYIRNRRWLSVGLVLCLALVAANRAEAFLRGRAARESRARAIGRSVRLETNSQGHNSIGIDEAALAQAEAERFLYFGTLAQWEYSRELPIECPPAVKQLSGRRFTSVGFMYPLEAGEKIRTFCLLRSTQTCCYGPRPQYNQYLLVETPTPVSFERFAPVAVSGKLVVEANPDEGYIYRMEADAVWSAEGEIPEVDPVSAAARARLPLFNFAPLETMGASVGKTSKAPAELQALDGRKVVISGFCVDRTPGGQPQITVGKRWWDGVSQGEPPTIHNAVIVEPADADQVPPVWQPEQTFTGTLHITEDPDRWRDEGILQIREAVLGVPGVTPPAGARRGRPRIPWPGEALALCLAVLPALGIHRKSSPEGIHP